MGSPDRVRVTGPLAAFSSGFAAELVQLGYRPNASANQLQLMAHLSRWMTQRSLAADGLTASMLADFLAARRAAGYRLWLSTNALTPLIEYLRGVGVTPVKPDREPGGAVEALLARYRGYLVGERGLSAATAALYVHLTRPLLASRMAGGELDLASLTAADVTAFVVASCPGMAKGSAKMTVTALRSLLGWLHVDGVLSQPLAWAVPSVAAWRLARLPQPLEPGQVAGDAGQLRPGCRQWPPGPGDADLAGPAGPAGRRGRRAAAGRHRLAGRGDHRPGQRQAQSSGCRCPPTSASRSPPTFATGVRPGRRGAPGVPAGQGPAPRADQRRGHPGGGAAAQRAGLGTVHAHRLRHSAATGMLRAGAALPEIGQVLRHRRLCHDGDLRQDRRQCAAGAGPPVAGRCGMSPLRQALADYLAVRRALGYKLAYAGKLLGQFVSYLEDAGSTTITTADAVAWATLPGGSPWWHAQRLSMVRGFATYLHTTDPAAEIPPPHVMPARTPRATPYLYSDDEVAALMAATASLSSPLRAATYQTLIGLLAATGMRVGEAIRLDRADFDPAAGLLTVRNPSSARPG